MSGALVRYGTERRLNYISIFVIDKSGSMAHTDRRPLAGTPVTNDITRVSNNRLGAVGSALHAFWSARQAIAQRGSTAARRDAYSVLMFDTSVYEGVIGDVELVRATREKPRGVIGGVRSKSRR